MGGFTALATAPAPDQALAVAAIAELTGAAAEAGAAAPGAPAAAPSPFTTLGGWRLPGLGS